MIRKLVSSVLVVALVLVGTTAQVSAAVIGTQQALAAEARQARIAEVQTMLARADVEAAMVELGVDPAQARLRVASLSDAELAQLHGQLQELPAGGVLAVLGVILVVFIVLDLTGVVKIFRR
ncbi:PA2779 family protein [Rehaibacterium terrae]|jgi:hypothetical protein|uniref:PA2779 family protein n=1 Tax=Rehaibacterium terrae TaxID=1341696 RepID=A0A7W8DET9_9GAMM|nr:PA2779 family protein [Rehaibacterium terrae]MBB5015918.1 hypothetical protein [Rehaibacterium terrae]